MARPSFTNITDATIDLDSGVNESWLEDMRDNIENMRIAVFGVNIAEDSTTTGPPASYADVTGSNFFVYIPATADYTGIQRKIDLTVETKIDNAATTGSLRLYDVTNTTAGTDVQTTTSVGTYEPKTLTIDIAAGDKGTRMEFKVQFSSQDGTNNVFCRAVNSFTGRLEF